MRVKLCVSLPSELRDLMKDRGISPSYALKVGVNHLLGQTLQLERGITIQKTEKTKRMEIQTSMQDCINKLNDELKVLRRKK